MSESPAQHRRPRSHRRKTTWWLTAATLLVAVALAGLGTAYALGSRNHPATATSPAASSTVVPALQVRAVSPATGASGIDPTTPITVALSAPLSQSSPLPTLDPAVSGSWTQASPTTLEFVADGPLVPGSTEQVTVPGGSDGLVGAAGQHLDAPVTSSFTVAPGSTLRLQQLLAQLGYLPLTFDATTQPMSPQQEADVQQGTFAWRWANQPASLTSLWVQGQPNVITKGAVMSFESQHDMTADGVAGPEVWTALLVAAEAGTGDPQAYGYVYVSKDLPETATVYQNGAQVYSTPANTGVAGAPTADGTFPVFERFTSTTMTGTNPDGTKYSDPNIPWVSYFNGGDALHGFDRAQYGFPQSDGCVEMPPANAAVVYPMTPIGTLVSVQ